MCVHVTCLYLSLNCSESVKGKECFKKDRSLRKCAPRLCQVGVKKDRSLGKCAHCLCQVGVIESEACLSISQREAAFSGN